MIIMDTSIELLLLCLIGFSMVKGKLVPASFPNILTVYMLDFSVPCIVVQTLVACFSPDSVRQSLRLILSGGLYCFAMLLFGHLFYAIFKKTEKANILRLGIIFSNISLFGFPIVQSVMGAEGLMMYVFFTLFIRIFYYVLPPYLLKTNVESSRSIKAFFKGIFTPAICGTLVGTLIALFQIPLPSPVSKTISAIAGTCTPIGMLICGGILGSFPFRQLLRWKYFFIPLLRNLFVPAVTLCVLLLIRCDAVIARLALVYSALPMGVLLTTYAARYCRSEESKQECSAALFYSTVLAIVTVPLWLYIMNACFP